MTILLEPDAALASELLPSLDEPVRAVASLVAALDGLDQDSSAHAVILGPEASLSDVVEAAHEIRARRPDIKLLLLRRKLVTTEVASATAAGIDRVLDIADVPSIREELKDASSGEPRGGAHAAQGQVITVFSPKGGSGKTTISTNLAMALHREGASRVCLVDLDLEFGDVGISLRLEPVKSLVDAVTTDVPDNEDEAIALLTTPYSAGIDCILAPIEPGAAAKIPAGLVGNLLRLLKTRYDAVVVDTPSQLSETVLSALDVSDVLVLITNPELPSLKNLRLTLDTLDLLGYPEASRLIVFNKADDASGLSTSEVEGALGAGIDAVVPASRDVPASINRGVPIVVAKPEHPVSVALRQFAATSILKAPLVGARRRGRAWLFRRHA